MPDDAPTRAATPRRTKLLIAVLAVAVAALALCLNRDLNGDLYLLLFSGRYIAHHGPVAHDPFPTIEHGQQWLNQQWLSEVVFYGTERVVGIRALTVLYAMLIALPLGVLLVAIRGRGMIAMLLVTAFYVPGVLAIIHPRAAGFTLLLFSILVVLILHALATGDGRNAADTWSKVHRRRPRGRLWTLALLPPLLALWANLHGGFIAGLLLVALVAAGLAIDRWRGMTQAGSTLVLLLAAAGLLSALAVTFATPLGTAIWSYVASFRNPALKLASTEWQPATASAAAMAYVAVAGVAALLIWSSAPRPRAVMPALAGFGFVAFAAASMRNQVFVAPALAFVIGSSAPERLAAPSRSLTAAAAAAAAGALIAYGLLGPPNAHRVGNAAVRYAIEHPPSRGRIVAYAGPSSYILWRAPRIPVVIDGWLEHFSAAELRANFGILHGARPNPMPYVRRVNAGAVIAYIPQAIRRLERHGFEARRSGPYGTYLVRSRRGNRGT